MPHILFFDTETTGLPNYKARSTDPSQPSVMQLAAILTSDEGEELKTYSTYIHIGDKYIHPAALAAHNISREICNTIGVPKIEAFQTFNYLTLEADAFCCHNFSFDIRLMRILAAQAGGTCPADMAELLEMPYYCTMKSTIDFCALPFPSGKRGNKFPKLEELYKILFEEEFQDAHDALVDVKGTVKCFFELKKRGVM